MSSVLFIGVDRATRIRWNQLAHSASCAHTLTSTPCIACRLGPLAERESSTLHRMRSNRQPLLTRIALTSSAISSSAMRTPRNPTAVSFRTSARRAAADRTSFNSRSSAAHSLYPPLIALTRSTKSNRTYKPTSTDLARRPTTPHNMDTEDASSSTPSLCPPVQAFRCSYPGEVRRARSLVLVLELSSSTSRAAWRALLRPFIARLPALLSCSLYRRGASGRTLRADVLPGGLVAWC